jgi:hypothetical protein
MKTEIAGISFDVKELSVEDIIQMLDRKTEVNLTNFIISKALDPIGLDGLLTITNLTIDQLKDLTPSQLKEIANICKELNKDFFMEILPAIREVVQNSKVE